MPIGEAIKQDFRILTNSNPETPSIPVLDLHEPCCECNYVVAESVFTSDLNNDKSGEIFFVSDAFSNAVMKLEKEINHVWTEVATLNNTTYGTYLAYGSFTNQFDEKPTGYVINWRSVLVAGGSFGEGRYRIKCTLTPLFGSPVIKYSRFEWDLRAYTPYRVQETVRVEFWQNGLKGDPTSDLRKRDFGTLNWYNQIRLANSRFGKDIGTFTRESVRYQNGLDQWLEDFQVEEYILNVGQSTNVFHRYLRIDMMQADKIQITDYTAANPTEHINRLVKPNSNYEPRWNVGSKKASVEIRFKQMYQNLQNRRQ
jgi:hypothetical protein